VTRRWALRLTACLLAGAVVLTGCSEKQEASENLPTTSSPAPSEDALPPLGPEDLPMPDEARTQDAAGAEAFVRYYIDLINRTSRVMDAQPLRELSDGCRECDRIAGTIEKAAANGHRFLGGQVAITHLAPIVVNAGNAEFDMRGDLAAGSGIDASGAEIADLSAPAHAGLSGGAAVRWDPVRDVWVMTAFTLE